jgi:hypothetical protein
VLRHMCRTSLPDGRVMITGSNPNGDVETRKYATEYRVEYISPVGNHVIPPSESDSVDIRFRCSQPYMSQVRPTYTGLDATWNYGARMELRVALPPSSTPPIMTVSLMDLGFSTHGVHSAYYSTFGIPRR